MTQQIHEPKPFTGELRNQWKLLFGSEPPPGLGHDLLARAIGHRTQEIAHGGRTKGSMSQLARLEKGFASPSRKAKLKAGTQLFREWQGATYVVTANEDDFEFAGSRYASLSEIAGVITGTKWSGPKFFGLRASTPVAQSSEADG